MSRKRDHIKPTEYLAAALACLLPQEHRDELRNAKVEAKVVIALFHRDHIVLHAHDGSDLWWNLDPKLALDHIEKSKRDTSIAAKVKRVNKEPEKWRGLIGPKSIIDKSKPKKAWPKRPFPKNKRGKNETKHSKFNTRRRSET